MFHQSLPGEDLSWLSGEEADQIVLPLGQLQRNSILKYGSPLLIDGEPSAAQGHALLLDTGGGGGGHGHPADVGLHPGHQLPDGEGFCDIVVRPQLQAQHLVLLLLPGGEHENGGGGAGLPDFFAHLKAAQPGQHQVQQNEVRVLLQGQLQAGGAVQGLQGVVPFPHQIEGQDIHNVLLILNN